MAYREQVRRLQAESESVARALVELMNKHFEIAELSLGCFYVRLIDDDDSKSDKSIDVTKIAIKLWDLVNRLLPETKQCAAGYFRGWFIKDSVSRSRSLDVDQTI